MKKRFFGAAIAAGVCAAACFAAVGCGGDRDKSYTVSFIDGDKVLKTVTVANGGTVESYRPVKDGQVFKGWYTEADGGDKYVFDGKITGDTSIYARFEPELGIRVKGSYITGWEHPSDAEYCMTYNAETDLYTYSHEFVEGDEFMFYNFEKTVDADGTEHMGLGRVNINADSIDKEKSTENLVLNPSSNIKVGKRGTFGFTYDDNTGKCVVTYSDAFTQGYTPSTTWYIAGGGITQPLKKSAFGRALTDEHKLTAVAGKENEYSITLDLAKGDLFQIVASGWYARAHKFDTLKTPTVDETVYFEKRLDNIEVKESGNYTITLKCDPLSPTGDVVEWVRNGDVVQELPVVYDVFMKCDADEWKPGARNTAADGIVKINAHFEKDDQFCFIYYDPGVDESEVGSFGNPGSLITNAMKGKKRPSNFNDKFSDFENNFVCDTAGYYTIRINFNGGTPVVDFIAFSETIPEYELVIKGPAYNGDALWGESERFKSTNGEVELTLTLTMTEGNATLSEFGFTWWNEESDQYGTWVGAKCIGTDGDANDYMVIDGKNNFECQRTGKYRIVIKVFCGVSTVDFYIAD